MPGIVLLDANILALLVIGATSRDYISQHKNTKDDFNEDDFDLLNLLIKDFSEIFLVPHIVAETSNLVRQIGDPKRRQIQSVFAVLVSQSYEIPVASIEGMKRRECSELGVTGAVLLHLCSVHIGGDTPTLLTIDGPLTDRARASNCSVINYRREFKI